jgi:hypothetical protein
VHLDGHGGATNEGADTKEASVKLAAASNLLLANDVFLTTYPEHTT